MSRQIRSAYAGGYSDSIRRQLENVVIPEKVKCATCKKIRMQSAFSKRQLDLLRNAMVLRGGKALTGPGHASCRTCVGGQTVELRCTICDQTKSLEQFAKNQRHDRDSARCMACVQSHTETEAVLEENKMIMDNDMSTVQESTIMGSQPSETYPYAMSTCGGSDEDSDDGSIGGGVWIESERDQEGPTDKKKGREYTGYDQHGNPHRLVSSRPASGGSVHTGWASWGVSPISQATGNTGIAPRGQAYGTPGSGRASTQRKSSKFAKVPVSHWYYEGIFLQ
ncbi:Stc1 domain-containing protein [Aspergillus avenaceus]|uniref:Stc1 domain-containing protein n=1 Tax=Aspergillus avenaceus TaxID=36643 RepID=A0A5N6TGD8_ASPAV|nr:Stc1 domain-containing protein [Aspergillus avenaceus]